MNKKTLLTGIVIAAMSAALMGCGASGGAKASGELPKNIEVQVPAKAGGGTDVMARTLGQEVATKTGSNVTIVNNTDGGGVVAMETVRTAKGDGAKILQYHTSMLIKSATKVYDKTATDDFKVWGVSQGTEKGQYVLVTSADSDMKTIEDFVNKGKSEEIKMGIETGGTTHVITGLMSKASGVQVKYVEAGSDTEKLTALVGNTIDACIVNVNQAKQYVESGKANALAVITNGEEGARSSVLPDVPSLVESGIDCSWASYNIFAGPKDMSEDIAKKLYDAYAEAAKADAVNEVLAPAGMAMEFLSYEEGPKKLAEQQADINSVVEELGLVQK
jgi:tripartite-type tricarboxylate transporter receptor subunit TctC